MIRTLTAGAALALSLIGPASALTLIGIDDFELQDQWAGDGALGKPIDGPSGPVSPRDLARTITHTLLAEDTTNPTGSFVSVGPSESGLYSIKNDPEFNSVGTVAWTLTPGFIPQTTTGAATLKFDVMFNDLGVTASLYVGSSLLGSAPLAGLGVASFALTAPQQDSLSSLGGDLKLSFSGPVEYDFSIDNARFEISPVPEASTAAMTLAGLLALYSLRRRSQRRQSDV